MTCIFSRPVKLVDFPNHVTIMSKDSDFKFSEEFEVNCVVPLPERDSENRKVSCSDVVTTTCCQIKAALFQGKNQSTQRDVFVAVHCRT